LNAPLIYSGFAVFRFFEFGDAESYRKGLERIRKEYEKEKRGTQPPLSLKSWNSLV